MILSGSTSGGAATGGTSASRYSFFGTGMRFPIGNASARRATNTNTRYRSGTKLGSPGYATTNPRFFMPGFITDSAGTETTCSADVVVESVSIKISGVWYSALNPGTCTAGTLGVLLAPIAGVTIPADTLFDFEIIYTAPASTSTVFACQTKGVAYPTGNDFCQGSTGAITIGATPSNSGGHSDIWLPSYGIALGGDGREAHLITGNSLGYGAEQNQCWDARRNFGGISRGLDDNTTSKRIAHANMCISGTPPPQLRTAITLKANAIKLVYDEYGYWPFDRQIDEHGHNAAQATAVADTKTWLTLGRSEWGKPITKAELCADPNSTDGWQTLANQSLPASWDFATGSHWAINKATSTNGIADAAATWRADGTIDDSFAPWLNTSYDTTTNRDKHKVTGVTTTITNAIAGGAGIPTTLDVGSTASLALGDNFIIDNGQAADSGTNPPAWGTIVAILNATQVTIVAGRNAPGTGHAAGSTLSVTYFDGTGTHPSSNTYKNLYAAAVVSWKIAKFGP